MSNASNLAGFSNESTHNISIGSSITGNQINISGNHNVSIGESAGSSLTTGNHNNFFGRYAGCSNTTGSYNNFLTAFAGCSNDTGSDNNFLGQCAGCSNTNGFSNNFLGRLAGCSNTSGNNNNFFGLFAGRNVTTGSCNIVIGPRQNTTGVGATNEVHIDNGINVAEFSGSDTSWSITSDERDKTNIVDINYGRCFLGQLRPRTYQWNHRHTVGLGDTASGFIAQEIKTIVDSTPGSEVLRLVDTKNPEHYKVASSNLIPVLVKAIQELSEELDAVKARLAALEGN